MLLPTITDEALDELRGANARAAEVFRVRTSYGDVVLRTPFRAEFKRFQAEILDEKKRADAGERLVRACVLAPDLPTFDSALDARPGLATTLLGPLVDKSGASGAFSLD